MVFHEIIFPFVSTEAPSTDPFVDFVILHIQDDAATSLSPASSSPSSNAAPTPRHPIIQDASNDLTTQQPPSTIVSAPNGPWRSTSAVSRPCFLQDFHCSLLNAPGSVPCTSPHSLDHVFSYDKLSPSHWFFALSVSVNYEPQFYHQAVKFVHWRPAMHEELTAMADNGTWSVVPLPQGKKTIGCRWIFKSKYKSDGTISHHKARLVAKGYNQREGIDFLDVFSLVAKFVTVKFLIALAASHNWILSKLDVNNAFLDEDLYEEVYMELPLGYTPQGSPYVILDS